MIKSANTTARPIRAEQLSLTKQIKQLNSFPFLPIQKKRPSLRMNFSHLNLFPEKSRKTARLGPIINCILMNFIFCINLQFLRLEYFEQNRIPIYKNVGW